MAFCNILTASKADIRNPLSLLAHERSRFATCQWELLTPTDISIPLTYRLVLYALEAGECLSQSRRLPLLQVVSNNKSISVGVQSLTEINAPRGCAVILKRICQLTLTRITRQVSRAFDLNLRSNWYYKWKTGKKSSAQCRKQKYKSSYIMEKLEKLQLWQKNNLSDRLI